MNTRKLTFFIMLGMTALCCHAQRFLGGDISLLPTNETANPTWLDKDGKNIADILPFCNTEGMNAMRVRLFVNPSDYTGSDKDANACQDLEYVKALGKRIKDAGFKLMLDFHYSDTWADPAKQWTPKAWEGLNDEQLNTKIYDYTKDALQQMKAAGAEPDFIQTGNEISYGMLWGAYGASESALKKCYTSSSNANWTRFTTLLKNAGKACREVCPQAKIILHTERAAQTGVLTNFYNRMKTANVDYDIIGLSYYPIWHKDIATLETALNTLESNYPDKNIMIVEVGYAYSWEESGDYNYFGTYPATEAGQQEFTKDLITMLNKHSKVTGLFWWWMEYNAYPWATTHMEGWWYAPLFNSNTGKAMPAFYEMKSFLGGQNGISAPTVSDDALSSNKNALSNKWFNLNGQRIGKPAKSGVYVNGGKKVLIK